MLDIDHRHRSHEGVTSLGIGYGTFILDHTPFRGFPDAEVQWTRNPSDAAVRRWSPSTAWKKLATKRGACDKAPVWQQFHVCRPIRTQAESLPSKQIVRPSNMERKRILILAGGIIIIAGIGGSILARRDISVRPAAVSAIYVGRGDFTNGGILQSGPTFWLTNHSSKAMAVSIESVQVRNGTNWGRQDYPGATVMLAPSTGAYATIDFAFQQYAPPTNTWRIELRASEKLARPDAFIAAIRHLPLGWSTLSTLSKHCKATWYGHPRVVLSEEVEEH